MARFQVKPMADGLRLSHPIDGPLQSAPDGNGNWSEWTADQFTFRLINDGAIARVEPDQKTPESPVADAPARTK